MALDDPTRKMSASESVVRPSSGIDLVDPPVDRRRSSRPSPTPAGRSWRRDKPAVTNLLTIFAAVEEPIAALEERFRGRGYGDLKTALAEAVVDHLGPIRGRYEELVADPSQFGAPEEGRRRGPGGGRRDDGACATGLAARPRNRHLPPRPPVGSRARRR